MAYIYIYIYIHFLSVYVIRKLQSSHKISINDYDLRSNVQVLS
jgi:hypothetical protein